MLVLKIFFLNSTFSPCIVIKSSCWYVQNFADRFPFCDTKVHGVKYMFCSLGSYKLQFCRMFWTREYRWLFPWVWGTNSVFTGFLAFAIVSSLSFRFCQPDPTPSVLGLCYWSVTPMIPKLYFHFPSVQQNTSNHSGLNINIRASSALNFESSGSSALCGHRICWDNPRFQNHFNLRAAIWPRLSFTEGYRAGSLISLQEGFSMWQAEGPCEGHLRWLREML